MQEAPGRDLREDRPLEIVDADLARRDHAEGVLRVLDSYASDPVGGGRPLADDVRERLVPGLRAHPTAHALLALSDGRAVGVIVWLLGFSTFAARPLLNLHDVAVLPEWRGRGIGRALLEAAEARGRQHGCCKLTLEVQDDNARARGLYRSFGFEDFEIGGSGPTRFLEKRLVS